MSARAENISLAFPLFHCAKKKKKSKKNQDLSFWRGLSQNIFCIGAVIWGILGAKPTDIVSDHSKACNSFFLVLRNTHKKCFENSNLCGKTQIFHKASIVELQIS